MIELSSIAAHGLAAIDADMGKDVALAVVRVGTGAFFACSGWNKLVNAERHAKLVETFKADKVPFVSFNQWWVPGWELTAGTFLALGLYSAFAASVLFIICAVACFCEASKRVAEYKPINWGDKLADYLYLPEVLYLLLLAVNILAGTGRFALQLLI